MTIGELISDDGGQIKTGPFGTVLKAYEYSDEGVPLISVGEVTCGSLRINEKTPRVPPEVIERLPEYVLFAGDIVFGRKGAVDRSAIVKPSQAGWFLGSDGIRLRLPRSCDSLFIAYSLQSPNCRSWLMQHATGTTMASLNQAIIERLPLLLPPLPEQRAIAHILGTLDDKIECNRRMNETLEKMAQAIFKSWFVDFDPVRWNMDAKNGKAVGKPPVPPEILKLFPDSFQESELGLIPKGWEVVRFCDLIAARQGKYIPKTRISDHQSLEFPFPVWGGNGVRGFASEYMYSSPVVVITCRGSNCGIVKLTESETWVSNISFACKPFMGSAFFLYIYLSLCSVLDCISGSAQPQITYSALKNKQLPFPVNALACKFFSKKIEAFYKKIMILNSESLKLAALRDTLLPKLISGELRIKDAEKFIEALS